MEKEMEKQIDSKIKKNKLNLIVIILIIFISLVVLAITLKFFLFKQPKETILDENPLQENSVQESNSTIVSVIPNENNDVEESIEENTTQENISNNKNENNISSSTTPENNININININTNTNSNANTIHNTNTNVINSSISNNNSNNNSNTTNNTSNNTTNDSSGSGTTSTPPSPSSPTVKPYIVKTETSKELTKTETKYGVLIKTYTTYTYDIYSDGSKKVTNSYDTVEYDKTNYNATTPELLSEARIARNQYSSMINQIFKNVNNYRQEANANSVDGIINRNNLSINENLCIAACARALEMAYSSKFSHTRPNGSNFYSILKEMNISYMTAGENIAYGYSSADSASEGWKNSQGHYENMISPDFSQIGIGIFKLEGSYYWVQIFN